MLSRGELAHRVLAGAVDGTDIIKEGNQGNEDCRVRRKETLFSSACSACPKPARRGEPRAKAFGVILCSESFGHREWHGYANSNQCTVNLTGVTNQQYITVTF